MPASEQDFLNSIDRHFPNQDPGVALGRGDDCAILDTAGALCVSTDLFVEHAHFRRSYFAPGDIGHKALAAAASDLAAMGAAPVGFALSLMLPGDGPGGVDDAFLDALLCGMAALSARLGLPLVGGDLSRGAVLALDVVVFGRPGPAGRLLKRGGARPGDALLVLGDIGLARAGLLALEAHGCAAGADWPASVAAHLRPEPRLAEGLALAALPAVRGLMDVSDGLARDLPRFLGALGADLHLGLDGLPPEVAGFFAARGEDALDAALLGGEDYALLACVDPQGLDAVLAELPQAVVLGRASALPGLRLNGDPFRQQGFDHFSK